MIYYVLPFLAYLGALVNKKRDVALWVLCAILIILFIGSIGAFRDTSIGQDSNQYELIYTFEYGVEPLFIAIIKCTKTLSSSYYTFLFIVFSFAYALKIYVFNKLSPYFFLSLLLYSGFWFLVYDINGIRQGLSLGFIGLAGVEICNLKRVKGLLWIIVATLIHYSALIFTPILFLISYKFVSRKALCCVSIIFILCVFHISIYNIISLFYNDIVAKIISYSKDLNYNKVILFSFSTIHRILIYLIIVYTLNHVFLDDNKRNFLLWCAFLNLISYLLLSDIEIIATRASLPFRFFECISLAYIPRLTTKAYTKLFFVSIIFIYVIFQVKMTLDIPDNALMPYKSFFYN